MATQSHFVTLFSNASRDIYEQYTYADFMVKIVQTVDLGSTANWEVGLFEISCFLLAAHRREPRSNIL